MMLKGMLLYSSSSPHHQFQSAPDPSNYFSSPLLLSLLSPLPTTIHIRKTFQHMTVCDKAISGLFTSVKCASFSSLHRHCQSRVVVDREECVINNLLLFHSFVYPHHHRRPQLLRLELAHHSNLLIPFLLLKEK